MSVSIQSDLRCVDCGYNLRGLSILDACPECGSAIRVSVTAGKDEELQRELQKIDFRDVIDASGYTIDAILFVRDCVRHAGWKVNKSINTPQHTSALVVCEALREYALWYFGDAEEAIELLAEWGIHRSEDVGKIVFALVSTGRMQTEPTDTIQQFDGLFLLDDWLRQPTP